jgi:RNA polymerase primary sigma factor
MARCPTTSSASDRPLEWRDPLADLRPLLRAEKPLSPERERVLAEAARAGDADARARLVRGNLRLVVTIARRYEGLGVALEDLVGEGCLGLLQAVRRYDPARGARFGTYAGHWIRQAIRRSLSEGAAAVRLPAHAVILLGRWRRAQRRLVRELGCEPTADQIASRLGLGPAQRATVERAARARRLVHASSDQPVSAIEQSDELADAGPPPDAVAEAAEEKAAVLDRIAALGERERAVLGWRYGLGGEPPMTLSEVARRLGLSREWAGRLEARALRRLSETTFSLISPARATVSDK